jgi:RNA polymerase sigma-70 factor, ECF subfamily
MVPAVLAADADSKLAVARDERSASSIGQPSRASHVTTRVSSRERMVEIVQLNFDAAWQFARRLGVRPNDIEDTVQQVFLVVAERLDTIEPGRERSFVFGITLRVVHKLRYTRATRPLVVGEPPEAVAPSPTPEDLAHRKSERERIERILGELPHRLREVFVLYELERLSVPETAELLRVAEGTVASRLSRARDEFRRLVRREETIRRAGSRRSEEER